ncbi:TIGR03905 family TSCPD domain-containing protein [Maridesulfovibrio sp. FT414]|uniref:TIGR03905 family TSCPD domain-containing protein n=1 Tax=Maridesulfovibrio sp. FT414 TaxID=2979469 RepID=UPI003D806DD9
MENITLQPTIMNPLSGADFPQGTEVFVPTGVCAKQIRFKVENDRLTYVQFTGGCDGNLKAISALVKNMEVKEIISKLRGITCGKKNTSCGDQLCAALAEHM